MRAPKKKNKEKLMRMKPLKSKTKEFERGYTHLTPLPFPSALRGKKKNNDDSHILKVPKQVKVNILLLDMIKQVPTYAKFLKDSRIVKNGSKHREKYIP